MDDEQVTEACQFLCGACSCEVKAQNPGWDLLFNCDWDARLTEAAAPGEVILPPAPDAKPAPTEAELVPIAKGELVAGGIEDPEQERSDGVNWILIGAAILAVGSGVALARGRR